MKATADVGQLIYVVKERNIYLSTLKEINKIVSSIDDPQKAGQDINLIAELCKNAITSPRKIKTEVNKAVSSLMP